MQRTFVMAVLSLLAAGAARADSVTGGGWIDSPPGASGYESALAWNQDFAEDAAGWFDSDDTWYGTVTWNAAGEDATFEGDASSAPFSRFDGYRDEWLGSWTAEIDVYLDPAWAAGTGFDYSVAANGPDGNHQRDFIFHVTKDTSTGDLLVAGSNNTNFAPREDLETVNHYVVTAAGWYTLQHVFYEDGGALAVDLNLIDSGGNTVFTETRFNAADAIPAEVGGNRYAWFTFINVDGGVFVDNHRLYFPAAVTGKASFGFNAKDMKNSDEPKGQTQFTFENGGLNFHGSSYDRLETFPDGTAELEGAGTVNGEGLYRFQIWAGDGDPDTFRIKIWEDVGGSENVIYDNGTGQPLGGGNISVK